MQLDNDFIAKVLGDVQTQNSPFPLDSNFSVDTRLLQKGDIFVALQGKRVDGHDFIQTALDKGASGFMVAYNKKDFLIEKFGKVFSEKYVLFVDDTMKALVDLAKNWRKQFSYPVVAVTGSVGKTTTKEMVRNILKLTDKKHIVSFGNQNTLIGVSLNILKMRSYHQVAVFEVGIGDCGAMKELAQLVLPTYALITKVGHSHIEKLQDVATVAREKRDVFSTFTDRDIGIINGDQPELAKVSYKHPVVKFGYKTTNQIQARKVTIENNTISFIAKIYNQRYSVVLQGSHEGQVVSSLAAMSIAYMLQIPNEIIIKGIEQHVAVQGRFEVINHKSGSILINDGYNSNPDSAKASLLAFDAYKTDHQKVLVLGDMLELGSNTVFWHRQIGRFVRKIANLRHVVLVGKHVEHTKKTLPFGVKITTFESADKAYESLNSMLLDKNNIFLFKASNSMGFTQLVKKLLDS